MNESSELEGVPIHPSEDEASFFPSQEEPASYKSSVEEAELPMVVWLRGDEAYFSDFSFGAEKVMELLGIKRSRLNQLSGRELRVGRTRIQNYVRPVYRPIDVEAYLAWIRPTVSHQRSSQVLNQATEKLSEQSHRIEQALQEQREEFHQVASQQDIGLQKQLFKHLDFKLTQATGEIETQMREQYNLLSASLYQTAKTLLKQMEVASHVLQTKLPDLQSLNTAFLELLSASQYQQKVLLEVQKIQLNLQQMLGEHILEKKEPEAVGVKKRFYPAKKKIPKECPKEPSFSRKKIIKAHSYKSKSLGR